MQNDLKSFELKALYDKEYFDYISDILGNDYFEELKHIKHHDSTRYLHSLKVSYLSYKIAKTCNLDCESTARGGLLHDFFFTTTENYSTTQDKLKIFTYAHPIIAAENAKCEFNINNKEENIIKAHMYPLSKYRPKYIESVVVSIVDKVLGIEEFIKKGNLKLSSSFAVFTLFMINRVFK